MTAFRFAVLISLAFAATAAQAQTTNSQTTDSTETTDSETVVATPHPAAVPVPTAATTKPASSGKALTTDEQITAWVRDAPQLNHAAPAGDGDTNLQADGTPAPRQVHGSAGVSVGSNGYSSAYVSSLIPVGKDSTLGIAVAQSNWGGTTVDHGRYRLPKGRSQSVAVSLQLGGANETTPDGCPGFMDGGRYVEPVWWSRLHPDAPCVTETDTHTETTYGQ